MFLRSWFNDLLMAPCAIPVVFWIFRRLELRRVDDPPKLIELGWILAVWSVLFEWIGPMYVPGTTADWRDVVMYWAGGFFAWGIWRIRLAPNLGMSFDPLARYYSAMEWLLAGRKLQVCRTAFIPDAAKAKRILLVGEGHGRFLEEISRAAPNASICYVDASLEMCRAAQGRIEGHEDRRIDFHSIPILQFETDQSFDLIATQFFLDCFAEEELQRVITKLARLLQPGGFWLLTDFQVPRSGWQRWRAQVVLALAYSFFRIATRLPAKRLVAPQSFLKTEGFQLEARKEFNFRLLYAELWRKS